MQQFIRFCLVGVFATAADAGFFYLFRQWLPYQVSMIISYTISLCLNTVFTLLWTFDTCISIRNIVCVVGAHLFNLFIVRFGLMALFVNVFGLNDRLAFIPTLGISILTNYFIIKAVINKTKRDNHGRKETGFHSCAVLQ